MKSLVTSIASVIASILLIPQLSFAEPVPGLLGRWKTEGLLPGNGMQFRLYFNFSEHNTDLQVRCLYPNGTRLTATVNSNTSYDANNICIHERNQAVVDDGIRFCRATLNPAVWTAYFDGTGKMVLFVPPPYQSQFKLVPVNTTDTEALLL